MDSGEEGFVVSLELALELERLSMILFQTNRLLLVLEDCLISACLQMGSWRHHRSVLGLQCGLCCDNRPSLGSVRFVVPSSFLACLCYLKVVRVLILLTESGGGVPLDVYARILILH